MCELLEQWVGKDMKKNDYRVIYTLESGTVLERPISLTQVRNLLVHERFNRGHCESAVYTEEGELIGECLSGTDKTLPDEYRYGWYNTELITRLAATEGENRETR